VRTFNISCGGASSTFGSGEHRSIQMDVQGSNQDVTLKIEDISRAMVSNIPDVLLDLLEVAAYIYCADRRCSRGGDTLDDYGHDWRRDLRFTIPLREPDRWESPAVKEALRDALGFLSDDAYSFSFVRAENPVAPKELYFTGLTEGTFEPDEVALFSGGVDSFAGAVHDLVANDMNLALIGHFSATKVVNVQKELISGLQQNGLDGRFFYTSVEVKNKGVRSVDESQRTRSFLFACLGLVVARLFGKDRLTFYENGVVSLNLPIAKDIMGARATRTTHPQVLDGFTTFFSELLDHEIGIRTPLQWMTKREVVETLSGSGFEGMLGDTVSCTRTFVRTVDHPHCGVCSQCIDRRFAVLAAGMEESDPEQGYTVDLLTGDRSAKEQDVRMAVDYVKCFQKLTACPKNRFLVEYPEITSALRYFSGLSTAEACDRIYDLLQRHARDVLDVLDAATTRHKGELVRGELPAGSLLSMCFSRSKIEVSPPSGYDSQVKDFMDRLQRPVCEFAVDETAKRVLFKGDFSLEGTNYDLVAALLDNHRTGKRNGSDIAYIPAPNLAQVLGIADASLRQQVGRLRKLVTERLGVDLGVPLGTDDFIENKERAGYRLSPALREVSPGDL